jgi:transposase
MLQLEFSPTDIVQLQHQRFHHPHPRVQRKMEALLLKAHGLPHAQIAKCVGVCENTLRDYFQQYQHGGITALQQLHWNKPTSELAAHASSLEAYFRDQPPVTIAQAVAIIEDLTGLKRSPTQVGIFLKKLGLKRLKTYSVPAKYDADAQAAVKKKS